MVREVRMYFEGHRSLRQGLGQFFRRWSSRPRVRLIAGGGREDTMRDFVRGIWAHPESLVVLLVDLDGDDAAGLRTQLRTRVATIDPQLQVHFMVQVMETWFLADRQALRDFYGADLQEGRLPGNPRVEEIDKGDVLEGLHLATQKASKGCYHKTRHAPQLLARLDPERVAAAAPNCRGLLDILAEVAAAHR